MSNVIFQGESLTVVDDREMLTPEQAFLILWAGKSIMICDPPNFTAEHECDIYDMDRPIFLSDIDAPGSWEKRTMEENRLIVFEYLRGYELSK